MVGKLKPADIDSNAWFHVTEGRVDKVGTKFGSMLQKFGDDDELLVWPVTKPPQYWQFQPLPKSTGQYVVRHSATGANVHLSACFRANETTEEKTGICLVPGDASDKAQIWQIDEWGSSSDEKRDEKGGKGYRFINVGNGTDLWLDVHKGNPPFMSTETDDSDKPSQHWLMTSAMAVNAVEYSTIQTGSPAATGTPDSTTAATTDTTTTPSSPSSTSPSSSSSSSSSGLSTGAKAGIGVGVGVGALALLIAALFFFRRRRNVNNRAVQAAAADNGARDIPPVGEKFSAVPEMYAGGYHHVPPQEPQELSSGEPVAHNAQAGPQQQYELDATPASR